MELFLEIIESFGSVFPEGSRESINTAINDFLYSPVMIAVQIISGILTAVLVGVWYRLQKKTEKFKNRLRQLREAWEQTPLPRGRINSQWRSIQKRLQSDDESQWKLAIIEADAILDEVVKSLGYKGDTMGERMKKIKPQEFPYLDDAWRVHKVRNFIAHDPSYAVRRDTAQRALEIYRNIFNEFNVLEV